MTDRTPAYDVLDDFTPGCFVIANDETVRAALTDALAPAPDAPLETHLPFLILMHPDLDAAAVAALWGWKIRPTAVRRWVRETRVRPLDEAAVLTALAAADHSGF